MARVLWTLDPYVNISDQHYKTFFAQDFMFWDNKQKGLNIQKIRYVYAYLMVSNTLSYLTKT